MKILFVYTIGLSILVNCNPVPSKTENAHTKDIKTSTKSSIDTVAEASTDYDDSDMFLETQNAYRHPSVSSGEIGDHSIELQGGSQTFFPSFANLFQSRQPLGHSRPIPSLYQEGAYSQRSSPLRQLLSYQSPSFNGFRNSDYAKALSPTTSDANGLLGSGNFGVIRGGTFFSESSDTGYSDDNSYFNNNGHGRPAFYFGPSNPRPDYNEDQFANFRDFADINAPSNSAYSHFVVVYANKNATLDETKDGNSVKIDDSHLLASPKNIIERLAQIDEEQESVLPTTTEPEKKVKLSKSKAKLALLKEKKHLNKYNKTMKKNEPKDLVDPLLALS